MSKIGSFNILLSLAVFLGFQLRDKFFFCPLYHVNQCSQLSYSEHCIRALIHISIASLRLFFHWKILGKRWDFTYLKHFQLVPSPLVPQMTILHKPNDFDAITAHFRAYH